VALEVKSMQFEGSDGWLDGDRIAGDRRKDRRYPVELALRYKLIRRRRVLESGAGHTVDLSSGGILFQAERPLQPGLNVELSIDWPVLLHNVAPLRLVVTGRIVRSDERGVALRSVQHEFRTQSSHHLKADPATRGLAAFPSPVQSMAAPMQPEGPEIWRHKLR
jgi:hypothetical protein